MNRVGNSDRSKRRRQAAVAVAGLAALASLAACTTSASNTATHGGSADPTGRVAPRGSNVATPAVHPAAAVRAVITTPSSADKISPSDPVRVGIAHGKLTSVTMTNPSGKKVTGALSPDGTSWHTTEVLGYAKTYSISAVGHNAAGTPVTRTGKVTTLDPKRTATPSLQRIGGYPLGNHQTYGVAIVPVVHFDTAIHDKAAAERTLSVTTTPHVAGSWYWADDRDVHYRPAQYWPAGTKVSLAVRDYGKKLGHGLYGAEDISSSFTVGRKQLTVAYDTAPKSVNKVRVYDANGTVLRTMNTAMGEHGGTTANGQYINFYTLDGTYTVLGHEQPARMCSASYGLPADAPGGYACENIFNATKISTDGIYLHYLNTFYAQDHGQDVSHGCLNLNEANSMWYFKHSMVGDPVVIHGNKHAPRLQVSQGGDWTVPWSQWVKGSAA